MDEWVRSVHAARDLLHTEPDRMPKSVNAVRPVVYASWRRSRLHGLDPDRAAPRYWSDLEMDGHLTRVTTPIIERCGAALDQALSSLSLTDGEGRLLRRWVPDPALASRLDALDVVPSVSVDEATIGTSSVISLLSGTPTLVRGPEHFLERFHQLSCAGAPIVHPVTRRIVGGLHLTCRLVDTTPIVLSWVTDLAREIQDALGRAASRREQLLLDAYLAHNRDVRHPLVALDQRTIITNAAAARLIGSLDQALLWEHASRALRADDSSPRTVTLADGSSIVVRCFPLRDDPRSTAAVLKIERKPAERPERGPRAAAPGLPGLVGHGPRWREVCRQASRTRSGRVVVVGEAGTGRLAVARALAGSRARRVLDAADVRAAGVSQWSRDLAEAMEDPDEVLVLRHADLLSPVLARITDATLRQSAAGRLVVATSACGPSSTDEPNPLVDGADAVLQLPALRDRTEDLPALLAAFTARVVDSDVRVRWMPDAVQAMSRLDWPGNLSALESVVRRLVADRSDGYIGARDLPADLLASTSRRPLARLEQAEAQTILRALQEAGGNKRRAAESLGIARSTLYRKVRALGLDLTTAAY